VVVWFDKALKLWKKVLSYLVLADDAEPKLEIHVENKLA